MPSTTFPAGCSLSARLQDRDSNNFNFLRFVAATLVIFSHTFSVLGYNREPLAQLTGYESFGQLGVSIFFFMSGILVTKSWLSDPSIPTFVSKRCLRIFPGLIVSVLFGVLVIGSVATERKLPNYLLSKGVGQYLLNGLLPGYTYFLPGVFRHNPLVAFNGSLWTLPNELFCYFCVLAFGKFRMLTTRFFPLAAAASLGLILWPYFLMHLYSVNLGNACLGNTDCCFVYFLLGIAAYLYRHHILINRWIALLAAVLYLGTTSTGSLGYAVSFLSIPYLVLFMAQVQIPGLAQHSRWADLSLGMYIYAFPIQQFFVWLVGTKVGVPTMFLLSLTSSLAIAYVSWYAVEKPFLAKRWLRRQKKPASFIPESAVVLKPAL